MASILFLAIPPCRGDDRSAPQKYRDGRPAATLRMEAKDHGIVLRHGDGPKRCDVLGARDGWVFEADDTYYMHYDAAPRDGSALSRSATIS